METVTSIGTRLTSQEKLRRFEVEISPHLRPAHNLAKWLIRNPQDAEDAVQEAFLRAFAGFETMRGENPKAWLLAIVRNTCWTWLKRNSQSPAMLGWDEQLQDPAEPSPDPEALLLRSCDREQVREAMEQLPVEFREAIVLREFEGLSYREIATTAAIPIGTVMSRLARGREWLKRSLSTRKASTRKEHAPK
jgi:RNA polymerase sigma-70 factor (ECF subfamily)